MDHRRDIGRGTGCFDLAKPAGVISLVGEYDGVRSQIAEQPRRNAHLDRGFTFAPRAGREIARRAEGARLLAD